jgi:response regulator of citrate/malate metabolism
MSEEHIPPEECLRKAAESLEKAADYHEYKSIEERNQELNNALAWLDKGKHEGGFDPLLHQDDLAKQLVDLTPQEVDQVRDLHFNENYTYKELARNFRSSVTAVRTVVEYAPDDS